MSSAFSDWEPLKGAPSCAEGLRGDGILVYGSLDANKSEGSEHCFAYTPRTFLDAVTPLLKILLLRSTSQGWSEKRLQK